jgi:mannosylglycerate synthase
MVAIPFLEEDPAVVERTISVAASHPDVVEVVAVSGPHRPTTEMVTAAAAGVEGALVQIIPQQRIGVLRPGKGDAVNTAFRHFLAESSCDRLHFYDADIKTFNAGWIEKAEAAADRGYEAVRHYYPRAATDAMVTWMLVRPGMAMRWPESVLPRIEQPLAGELLFTRSAAEIVGNSRLVLEQSDWGIDTALTFATVAAGIPIYECYNGEGKDHALYGSLGELQTMLVECLGTLQRLPAELIVGEAVHEIEPASWTSPAIAAKVAFDVEESLRLLARGWTPRQDALTRELLPGELATAVAGWRNWPDTSVMNDDVWLDCVAGLLDHYQAGDQDWEALVFRLWVAQVIAFTLRVALRGHQPALTHLRSLVQRAAGWRHIS